MCHPERSEGSRFLAQGKLREESLPAIVVRRAGQRSFALLRMTLYPVESPTVYGGDEEKNAHSLLRVGFKAPPFLTGFTHNLLSILFHK